MDTLTNINWETKRRKCVRPKDTRERTVAGYGGGYDLRTKGSEEMDALSWVLTQDCEKTKQK